MKVFNSFFRPASIQFLPLHPVCVYEGCRVYLRKWTFYTMRENERTTRHNCTNFSFSSQLMFSSCSLKTIFVVQWLILVFLISCKKLLIMAFALSKIAKFVNKNALVTPLSSVMASKSCKSRFYSEIFFGTWISISARNI